MDRPCYADGFAGHPASPPTHLPRILRSPEAEAGWCGREDSNFHGLPHSDLNAARLPVPPRPPGTGADVTNRWWRRNARAAGSTRALEVLHLALVLFGGGARGEGAEVLPLAGLGVEFP